MMRIILIVAALLIAAPASAIKPGECGYVNGVWTCLPCPDPRPGVPSACVAQRAPEPEQVPVDHPLAIALGALVVGLVARDALRKR